MTIGHLERIDNVLESGHDIIKVAPEYRFNSRHLEMSMAIAAESGTSIMFLRRPDAAM